jgi:ATP/maltotriose-dependent transcriptional regulator MalT
MNARFSDALATQLRGMVLNPAKAAELAIRVGIEVAKNRILEGDFSARSALEDVLTSARMHRGGSAHTSVAVACNNLAAELLDRDLAADAARSTMLSAGQAALEFWLLCGTWVNEERAHTLLAMIYNQVGDLESAMKHGQLAMDLLSSHGEEKVDLAFLGLVLVRTYRLLGDADNAQRLLLESDRLAEDFEDGLRSHYFASREKLD